MPVIQEQQFLVKSNQSIPDDVPAIIDVVPVGAIVSMAQFLMPYSLILALVPLVKVLQNPDSKNLSASKIMEIFQKQQLEFQKKELTHT